MTTIQERLRNHLLIEENHEAGLIPHATKRKIDEAADLIDELVAALEAIAEPAWEVPAGMDSEMYEGWRDLAVYRIDIARAAIAKAKGTDK